VVVTDPEVKKQIREIIEDEEALNYQKRMGPTWLQDLAPIGTTWEKPYLEEASHLVLVFKQVHGFTIDGARKTHYYSEISVSISVGLFIAAVQVPNFLLLF
jgi:iodotyrosine deiodinase